LAEVCEIILDSLEAWERFVEGDSRSAILVEDKQSRGPMKLSVLLEVTRILVNFYGSGDNIAAHWQSFSTLSSNLLLLAVRSNFASVSTLLLGTDASINCCYTFGQTPLYLAV
jgi:hypothetical protein